MGTERQTVVVTVVVRVMCKCVCVQEGYINTHYPHTSTLAVGRFLKMPSLVPSKSSFFVLSLPLAVHELMLRTSQWPRL